jgi:DNA topoisomerase I
MPLQIEAVDKEVKEVKAELKKLPEKDPKHEKLKKKITQLKDRRMRLNLMKGDKEDNKTVALGTSKLNYCDPRITIAWCVSNGVWVMVCDGVFV